MAKVVRYFHIRTGKTRGGATVRVEGDTANIGQVSVQVTHCSRKDVFCKKTGRDEASKAPVKVVALRHLPAELSRINTEVIERTKSGCWSSDYTFSLKYFLPKE